MPSFDEDETQQPASNFQSQAAEGDIMAKQGEFRKAIDAYTRALNYRENDKHVLIARSRCYLTLGDAQAALEDAETALREDKDFFKAKYQKAEALYAKGDFELALVFYHRGYAQRPELDEFRLGIQKAREAIDNAIGKSINSRDYRHEVEKIDGESSSVQSSVLYTPNERRTSEKSARQLLGELYVDKEYLDGLLNDRDFEHNPNATVRLLVMDGLKYLNSRTEFWHQQKPIYARRKDSGGNKKPASPPSVTAA